MEEFVQLVNTVLQAQEESERVKECMNRIVGYSAVEMPSELKEVGERKRTVWMVWCGGL